MHREFNEACVMVKVRPQLNQVDSQNCFDFSFNATKAVVLRGSLSTIREVAERNTETAD